MKKIYISAPIAGYNREERREYFANIAKGIEKMGFTPVNPMAKENSEDFTREQHLKEDTKLLLECDEIWFYQNWHRSNGCMYEMNVAINCGIKIEFK